MATENADNKKLFDAINEVRNSEIKAKEIKGKSYLYVKDRNSIFRKHFGLDVSYHSSYELTEPKVFNYVDKKGKEVHKFIPESVIVKTEIFYKNKFLACGLAQEFRDSNHINITSAMENCQTSSLGRALACLDLTGTEFASADEMQIMEINKRVVDSTNNNDASDTQEKDNKHIPPIKDYEDDFSPGVSESEFVRISAALDNTKHLGQLKSVYTNDQIPIDSNEQLNKIYKNKLALFNRNKPTDDGWDI
jgi:hypothetical protein